MSNAQRKARGRPMGNGARRAIDYVNVEYASKGVGARNFLASIGGTQRINPESQIGSNRYNLSSSMDSLDGPLVASKARYRREKGPRSKAKRQFSSTLVDSDSSSMDGFSITSDMLEERAREEEHYNKLKLNVNHLDNKSVRKGVSVLYADKVNGEIGFRHRTPSGSRMTRPHNIPHGILNQQSPSHQRLAKSPLLTARNEGHGNRLHSVSGAPMPRFPTILWKKTTIRKSFSTSDMNKIIEESVDGQEVGEGKDRGVKARRSQSFSESTHSMVDRRIAQAAAMVAVTRKTRRYENVDPTAGVRVEVESPEKPVQLRRDRESVRRGDEHSRRRHSVIRNSFSQSTEVLHRVSETTTVATESPSIAHDCRSPTPFLSPTRSPQRQPDMKQARLSPLARPADMKSAPLSPLLQPATLHNDSCPINCSCHGIHFIDPIVTIPCDSNGGEYMSESHDFKIVIPKGAIKKRVTAELQIGVTLQGPFQTPQNTNIISPIVWVGVRPDIKLKKPIEIKLPHFLDLSQGSQKSEMFLKASDKATNSSKARYSGRRYLFKETSDNQGIFQEGHGILLTKSIGFFCIATSQLSKQQACCCLLPIIPKPIQSNTWKIHYCVTYLLKSCIQLIQQQFGEGWEILPPRRFKFVDSEVKGALEIQFERQLLEAGWILALESSNKILASEVELWSNKEGCAGVSESISSFPPRFTIRVHGGEARMSSMALIKFSGCSEELSSEIVLPLRPMYSSGDLNCTPLSTPTSTVFSPHHISAGSSQDSNFISTPVISTAPPQTTKLGWQCHSPSCVCDECSHDYDHLPSAEELGQTHVQLTYHNGHIDLPTDEDLKNIATKVTQCLQGDWTTLQTTLDIPDYIMLDVLSQRSIELQVYRLLKEWRNHANDCSKDKLAQCLAKADKRLEAVSNDLLSTSK